MTRNCAIYARVSTEEQNLDNQIKILKNRASEQNCKVFKIYRDKVSGGSANRPEFQQMLKDARLRKFDTIFVWSASTRRSPRHSLPAIARS